MKFDDLIECSRCGSDASYIQEVNADIKLEMCYGCGFQSNSLMKRDTDFFKEQMEVLPEIYKVIMDEEEETGKIWMPTIVRVKGKGMVFVEGTSRMDWAWAAVKDVKIKEDEKEKYKGEEYRADMTTVKHFPEREFMDALSYIEVLP